VCLSFWGPMPRPSFSPAKAAFKGAGDEDLRVMVGTTSELGSLEEGIESSVGGGGSVEIDGGVISTFNVAGVDPDAKPPLADDGSLLVEEADDDDDAIDLPADGVSNSTGLTRGMAWMLVMSFARSQ